MVHPALIQGPSLLQGSLLIYMYTNTETYTCSSGDVVAYAYICQTHDAPGWSGRGRPVLGFINLCMPWWPTMHTLLEHELMHVLGFTETMFTASFPDFLSTGRIGRWASPRESTVQLKHPAD